MSQRPVRACGALALLVAAWLSGCQQASDAPGPGAPTGTAVPADVAPAAMSPTPEAAGASAERGPAASEGDAAPDVPGGPNGLNGPVVALGRRPTPPATAPASVPASVPASPVPAPAASPAVSFSPREADSSCQRDSDCLRVPARGYGTCGCIMYALNASGRARLQASPFEGCGGRRVKCRMPPAGVACVEQQCRLGVVPTAPATPQRSVEGDATQVGGVPFDAGLVSSTFRTRAKAIQACYQRGLAREPGLAGSIDAEFTIETRGQTTDVRAVRDTVGDDALQRCVLTVVQRLRFSPAPAGGSSRFRYRLKFASDL